MHSFPCLISTIETMNQGCNCLAKDQYISFDIVDISQYSRDGLPYDPSFSRKLTSTRPRMSPGETLNNSSSCLATYLNPHVDTAESFHHYQPQLRLRGGGDDDESNVPAYPQTRLRDPWVIDENSDDDYEYANDENDSGDDFVLKLAVSDPMNLPNQDRSTHYHMRPAAAPTPAPVPARRDTVIDLGNLNDADKDSNKGKKRLEHPLDNEGRANKRQRLDPRSAEKSSATGKLTRLQRIFRSARASAHAQATENARPPAGQRTDSSAKIRRNESANTNTTQPSIPEMVDMLRPEDSRSLLIQLAQGNPDIRGAIHALTRERLTEQHHETPQPPPRRDCREDTEDTENTEEWEARTTSIYNQSMDRYRVNEGFRQSMHSEHPDAPQWKVPTPLPVRRRRRVSTPPSSFLPPGSCNNDPVRPASLFTSMTFSDRWLYKNPPRPQTSRVSAIQRGWGMEDDIRVYPSPPPEEPDSPQVEPLPLPLPPVVDDLEGEGEAPLPDPFQWEVSPPPLPRIDVTDENGETVDLQDIEDEEERLNRERKQQLERAAISIGALRGLLDQRLSMRKMRDEMTRLEEIERDHREIYEEVCEAGRAEQAAAAAALAGNPIRGPTAQMTANVGAGSAQPAAARVEDWRELVAQMTENGGDTSAQTPAAPVENQLLAPVDRRTKKSASRPKQSIGTAVKDRPRVTVAQMYENDLAETERLVAARVENQSRTPVAQMTADVEVEPKRLFAAVEDQFRAPVAQMTAEVVAVEADQSVAAHVQNRFRAPVAQMTAEVGVEPEQSAALAVEDWQDSIAHMTGDVAPATPVGDRQEPVTEQAREPDTKPGSTADAHPPLMSATEAQVEEYDAASDSSYDPDVSSSEESSC